MTEQQAQSGSQPPPPPPFPRRIQLHRVQLIGMPILMLVPLLAILGVFGETFATTQAANDRLSVQVQYATRSRYGMANPTEVAVHSTSSTPLTALSILCPHGVTGGGQAQVQSTLADGTGNVTLDPRIGVTVIGA